LPLLAAAYAALIVYGSLFPFVVANTAGTSLLGFLTAPAPARYSTPDIVTNVLAYMPLGLLLALWWREKGLAASVMLATVAGGALSFSMEFVQQFISSRVASLTDLITNTGGTLVGALLAGFVRTDRLSSGALLQWRRRWVKPGRIFDLGLMVIGLWALSQVAPLVPSLDVGNLRHGLAPLWQTLRNPETFNSMHCAVYVLYIAGLALLAGTLGNPGRPAIALFFAFVAAVLLYKIPVVGRQLSLEALAGALAAAALIVPLHALRPGWSACASALLILAGFVCAELASEPDSVRHSFNWVPFRGQLENTLAGIVSILELVWPAAAIAYLARSATPPARRRAMAWSGGATLALLVFGLEWYQQYLPGRYGDITAVLLMASAWLLFWWIPAEYAAGAPAFQRSRGIPARA
jgi:VanZ family protein